jgi:hypothetical protein
MKKISVVVTGRNDDYSGDLEKRMIPSLNSFIEEYEEIIYVDFNSENGSFIESIKNKISHKSKLRSITVTPKDIDNISINYKNKFIEVLARNIGIRRATGDFILSTNPDIICTYPNINNLDDKTMYVSARRDVPIELYSEFNGNIKSFLLNKINFFQKKPRVVDNDGNPIWDPNDRWSVVVCCGDYQLAHKDIWHSIKGFEESAIGRCYADSNLMKKAALNGYSLKELDIPVFHLNHNTPKYIKNDKETPKNCQVTYVQNFENTSNDNNWGFSNLIFKEEII